MEAGRQTERREPDSETDGDQEKERREPRKETSWGWQDRGPMLSGSSFQGPKSHS